MLSSPIPIIVGLKERSSVVAKTIIPFYEKIGRK